MKSFLVGVVVAGAVVGALALVRHHRNSEPARPVLLLAGVDTSRSVRLKGADGGSALGRSLAQLAEMGTSLQSGSDEVAAYRVDCDVQEFWSDPAPDDEEAFTWTLIKRTQTVPASDGTRPAKFWEDIAGRAEGSRVPVAVALWSDGDNDEHPKTSDPRIAEAARRLAANPRVVSVEVFGASSKNWNVLRQEFAPLGERFRLHPSENLDTDALVARLNDARDAQPPAAP